MAILCLPLCVLDDIVPYYRGGCRTFEREGSNLGLHAKFGGRALGSMLKSLYIVGQKGGGWGWAGAYIPRIFGGGGAEISSKQANKPNKRATEFGWVESWVVSLGRGGGGGG